MSKIFVYHKNKYELTDAEIANSSYLTTLVNTGLHIDKDEDGDILLILDVSPSTLQNYINFLRGNSFFLSDVDLDFFDFMGHDNYYEFKPEYWKSMLEGTRHNVCGDLTDKVTTITDAYTLEPLFSMFNDVDLYYIGDTALLSAGIISKPSSLPIVYHLKDREKIVKILNKGGSKAKYFGFNVELSAKDTGSSKPSFSTFKPMLQSDSEVRRIKNPDKIWNNKTITCTLYGLTFDCMENLLYLLPADTDGIAVHVKSSKVHRALALARSYRSYITRQVNLIPEYIHHEEYLVRLCNLSLMGFKINVPKFNDIVSIDEYKKDRLLHRTEFREIGDHPYSSIVTYLNNPLRSKELKLSREDYIALLSLGPTRPTHTMLDIPGKYVKKDVDITELYGTSQLVHDIDMIQYQYMKHEMDNMVYDGMFYKIGRIDTYDINVKDDKNYIVGHSLLESLKYDKTTIPHKFYKELPDVSEEVLDQCYCNVEDGIVYASLPLIDALYMRQISNTQYPQNIIQRLV